MPREDREVRALALFLPLWSFENEGEGRGVIPTRKRDARELLDRFATATGLYAGSAPRRYLWTDAFAVCTWAGLGEEHRAAELVDQVHGILGRHRPDDERVGWISGLPDGEAERRPTAGGLRIGKPLPERGPADAFNWRLEWERDGQYFHYLTQWIRALERMAATGDFRYHAWATELGLVAFDRFGHGPGAVPDRLYWKMSIDLSRPAVPSMGQHDPLDGYVALRSLRSAIDGHYGGAVDATRLDRAIDALGGMVESSKLDTNDPLGTGSLLTNAWFLARVTEPDEPRRRGILERVLDAAERSLAAVRRARVFDLPADQRLAFRELGLAIGLDAVSRLADSDAWDSRRLPTIAHRVEPLSGWVHLRSSIQQFWMDPRNQRASTWADHRDINTVMLATSLAPEGYLESVLGRV